MSLKWGTPEARLSTSRGYGASREPEKMCLNISYQSHVLDKLWLFDSRGHHWSYMMWRFKGPGWTSDVRFKCTSDRWRLMEKLSINNVLYDSTKRLKFHVFIGIFTIQLFVCVYLNTTYKIIINCRRMTPKLCYHNFWLKT